MSKNVPREVSNKKFQSSFGPFKAFLKPIIVFNRLKSRRGAKRAVVAIAHRITKAVYHIIKHGKSFVDLGEAYLMSKSKEKRIKALKLRAKYLGFSLEPLEAM